MATKQRSQMSTPKAAVKTVAHAAATIAPKPKAVSKIANTDVRIGAQKPAAKPAAKPVAKPVKKPAAKPAAKPVKKPAAKPVKKPAAKPAAKPPATVNGHVVNGGVALAPLNSYNTDMQPVANRPQIPASQFASNNQYETGDSKSNGFNPTQIQSQPSQLTNGMSESGSDEQNLPIDPTPKPQTAHAAIRKPGKHPSVKSTNPTGTHATSTAKHGATRVASPVGKGGVKHPKVTKPVHGALIGQVADTSNFAPHPDLNTVSEDTAGSTDLPSDSADAFGGGINGRTQSSGHQHTSPVSGWGDTGGDVGGSGDSGDATDDTPMASESQSGGGMMTSLSSIPMGVWIAVAGAGILVLIVALKGK